MATTHVTGWARGADAAGADAGDQPHGRAHAVLRHHADGPPPWVAECGAQVDTIRGSFPPLNEASLEVACPACLARLAP